ncbi:MAG: hypothetical protein A2170_08500 [Deltaproteobacteria bacterium RBG_13_53_10]|nr:MAG: hypothetical protein A2170_08500 [Deltaproteobacteria bacterium RBG_13_53_10]
MQPVSSIRRTGRDAQWKQPFFRPEFLPEWEGWGGVVLALVYAPIGIGIGEVLGATDARKWQPCIDGLKEEIEQLVPAAGLREQLGKALGDQAVIYETDQPVIRDPATIAAQHNCQSVLLADIQRIQLRECNRGMFYVEVATRVRLWDARTARYVFDETALYNNPKVTAVPGEIEPPSLGWMLPLPFPQPYEVVLSAVSPARELKEYCSADGRKIFAEELDTGVSHAIQHFTRVLRPLTGDNR